MPCFVCTGLNSHVKCCFKSILDKKHQFFPCGTFLLNVIIETFIELFLFQGTSPVPKNSWLRACYHLMIIETGGFSRNLYYYYFLEILLNSPDLVILEFKYFYNTHITSSFSLYLFMFYSLFRNHSAY